MALKTAGSRPEGRGAAKGTAAKARLPGLAADFISVLESARSAIFVVDNDGIITYLNSKAMLALGGDESLIGRQIWDVFPTAEHNAFGEAYRRTVAERVPTTFEAFSHRRNGWYEVHMAPLANGTYASFQNISERRAAAEQLRHSEERYRLAARATNDVIWDWNLTTDLLEWNDNLGARFGYTADRKGASSGWWMARIHADDRPRVLDSVRRVMVGGGDSFADEFRFERADGSFAHVSNRGYVVRSDNGEPVRLVGAMQDVTETRRAMRALAERERLMATIFGQAMVGILHRDLRTGDLMVNDRFCKIVGRTSEELRASSHDDYTHPDDLDWNRVLFETRCGTGVPFQVQKRYVRPDGEVVWCDVHVSFVRDEADIVAACIVVAEDITSRKHAELELVRSKRLLQTVIDSVDDLIFVKDRSGKFVLTNRALDEGCGDLMNRHTSEVFDEELAAAYTESDRHVIERGEPHIVDEAIPIKGYPRDFQTIKVPWLKDGSIAGIIGVSRDITDRIAAEENLRWSATHDALTSLPNRRLLQEALSNSIAEAKATGRLVSIIQVDLDHFKQVNDTLGHDAGDALLLHVAERLRTVVPAGHTVSRTGGDEFAVVLRDLASSEEVDAMAASLLERLREPFSYDGHLLDCRASLGVSLYPTHGSSPELLLKSADIALYRAKALGRGRAVTFAPEMRADIQRRSSMINAASDSLASGRVFPFYQPKVDLMTGEVAGFEALLRWRDPHDNLRDPADIAAAFDDPHLACSISDTMLEQAIVDMQRWIDAGAAFGHVAINAAAADFRRGDFAERVLERLARAGLSTRHLQLEVTETVFLGQGSEHVERALKLLSAEGVKIALDDFGTGYASLRHLKDFPVDSIKLDRSFIHDMEREEDDAAIVRAMLNLGHSIGIDVVAEGVETPSQAEHLWRIGCPFGQGYLFSKAVAGPEVPALLEGLPRWCMIR